MTTPPDEAPRRIWPWVLGCFLLAGLVSCGTLGAIVVLGGLAFAPDEVSPPAPPGPVAAAPAPAGPVTPGEVRRTVTTADLVGEWGMGERSTEVYVDRSSGAYAGSKTTAYGETYDLRGDGTYTSNFRIIEGVRMHKESATGTWTLSGSKLLLTESGGHARGWHFVSFEPDTNHESVLTLLADSYELTESALMYRTTWIRPVK